MKVAAFRLQPAETTEEIIMNKLAFAAALGADAIPPSRRNMATRLVMGWLRRWREHTHSRRRLCELNDHILQDIGLTRDALLHAAIRPFRR